MTQYDFDLFVIGAGSGGVRASAVVGEARLALIFAEESAYPAGGCYRIRGWISRISGARSVEQIEDASGD